MKSAEAERLLPLAVPTYLVAAMLILVPIIDSTLNVLPPRFGELGWRFGALGLGSQAVMTPLLGGLLVLLTAAVLGQRRGLRVVQILAWIAALMFLTIVVLFLLDAVQVRASVKPEMKGRFDKASVVALSKYVAGVVVAVFLARTSQRMLKKASTTTSTSAQPNLVLGMPDAK